MNRLLSTMGKCIGSLGNITLILALVIYIFAVLGMQLFGSSYTAEVFGNDDVPRWNFKTFGHSFMLVFRIICGEWIEPLWDCMRAKSPAVVLFFIPAFIIGNFIVSILHNCLQCFVLVSHELEQRFCSQTAAIGKFPSSTLKFQ